MKKSKDSAINCTRLLQVTFSSIWVFWVDL